MRRDLLLVGALGALGAGGVMAWSRYGGRRPGDLLFHPERLVGLDARLQRFAIWWSESGPWAATIPPDGALRTDGAHQAELFAAGRSRAATLDQTPHGRGAGLDLAPAILDDSGTVVIGTSDDWALLTQMGQAAEAWGLVWGGRWASLRDGFHLEVPDWRARPLVS